MRVSIIVLSLLVACSSTTPPPAPVSACGVSCDDGDPCTIDRCHPTRGVCLHHPSAYCTKPCAQDIDCSFASQVETACISMACVAGQCRYQELAGEDCSPCTTTADCAQSVCSPTECTNGFCRRLLPDCDDQDASTLDRCNRSADQCEHLLRDAIRTCSQDVDCGTDHPCEQFTCVTEAEDSDGGVCRRTTDTATCSNPLDVVRACEKNADCIQADGPVCVAGPCQEGFCRFQEYPYSALCDSCHHGGPNDNDCIGSFCQANVCTGTVCTQDPVSFCMDLDPATTDLCSDEVSACLHRYAMAPPLCQVSIAPDGDANTIDACDPRTGDTHYLPQAETPCTTTNRCYDAYLSEDGVCLAAPIECNDFDASTVESCDPEVGCLFTEPSASCTQDSDCDDGNPCTVFVCLNRYGDNPLGGQTGVNPEGCWGTYIDGCVPCTTDAECLGDDWCLRGQCDPEGFCDYSLQKTCDDQNPCTADFCHGWVNETCTFHEILGCSSS